MRRTTKVGIGFIFAGIALWGAWLLWLKTRHYAPVKMPVSMSVGHIRTKEFVVNIDARYNIEIEVEKKIPFDTLNCLLGMAPSIPNVCADQEIINANWVLSSAGKVIGQGSSLQDRGGGWANDTISREIGSFEGRKGQRYRLDLDLLKDGTALSAGNPRLTVSVDPGFIEGSMFTTALLIDPVAGVLALIGLILLIASLVQRRRQTQR